MNDSTLGKIKPSLIVEAAIGSTSPLSDAGASVTGRGRGGSDGVHGELGEFSYTRTRVVPLSPRHLEMQRVVTASSSRSEASDAYKILAIQVIQHLRERTANTVAVVSPREGEGRTLTAVNLAISLAAEVDHTVLLVDADLRMPSIHRFLGFEPEFGLADHLMSGTPLENVLVNPQIPRLVVLPGGRPIANSAEMLGSYKMANLVAELKQRYASRLIVFDLPAALESADALAFAPQVDSALIVVEEMCSQRDDLIRTTQILDSVDLIGTVLNKSKPAAKNASSRGSGWYARLTGRRHR